MRALITGIGGFVGPYLKRHLSENNFEVYGMDISSGKDVDYETDILNKKEVEDCIINIKPDLVFHLAAQSSVKLSFSQPKLTMNVNVKGTAHLLNAVKTHIPDSKVLIVSSADVYGVSKKIPIREDFELSPVSSYGKSRLEQEKLALSYGLNLVICRSFPHTGPGQRPIFVCSDFAKQIAEIENGKESIIYIGNIDVKRDFTDIRDIVRAYLLALKKCDFNEVYNVCSGKSHSIREILDILLGFTDKEVQIRTDTAKLRKGDISILEGDNSKFVKKTGWKPEILLERTLKDLLDYWRKNLRFK